VWGTAGTSETLFRLVYVCDRLISPTIFYEESGWMTVKLGRSRAKFSQARTLNCHLPSPTDSPTAAEANLGIASFTAPLVA